MSYLDGIDLDLAFRATTKPDDKEPEPRGAIRAIGDTALQFGKGAVSGVRMMTDVFGADNAASSGLRSADEALNGLLSATAKQDQARVAEIMQEAEGKGWMEQIGLGLKAAGVAPAALLAQAAGTSLPTLATALIPGAGPVALATRLGVAGAMGGVQGAGATKGAIYENTKSELLKAGASPEEAEARAVEQQSYGGDSSGQIALGGGLGVLAGSTGMERVAAGLRNGVTKTAPGIAARMGTGGMVEAVPELAQGGQEKYATNAALNNEGFQVGPMSGVVANATMEGAAGFGMGAAFGIPRPAIQSLPAVPIEPPGALTRAANKAAPLAAAGLPGMVTPSLTGLDMAQTLQDQSLGGNPLLTAVRAGEPIAAEQPAFDAEAERAQYQADTEALRRQEEARDQAEAVRAQQDQIEAERNAQLDAALSPPDLTADELFPLPANDQRLLDAGVQEGDLLNPAGDILKTKASANTLAKKEGGTVVPVTGGFVVRPTENTNVSNQSSILPVATAAAGRGLPESAPGLAVGLGDSGAAGSAVDAGSAGDQPAGGAVPSAGSLDDGALISTSNQPPAPATPTPAAIETVAPAADYSKKWFGSRDKAQGFIDTQGIGQTHAVAQQGKRWIVSASNTAPALGTQAQAAINSIATEQETKSVNEAAETIPPKTGQQEASEPVAEVAPEFVKIKTRFGDNTHVLKSDLDSDKPLLPMYDSKGSKVGKRIHRENLDPTGAKLAANNAENADNPHFDVVTTKDGKAFTTLTSAQRELNKRALQDSHEVVPASEVSHGAAGFVVRKKAKPADASDPMNTPSDEQTSDAEKSVDALTDDEAKAVAARMGKKLTPRMDAKDAIKQEHPDDIAHGLAGDTWNGKGWDKSDTPQNTGDFGPILTQYRHDAQGAIKALTELQDGEAVAALHHAEVGDIDLVWGHTSDNPRAKGMGLAKIVRWHPEVLTDLQGVLDKLTKSQKHGNQIDLRDDGSLRASVKLTYNEKAKHWLLTAYDKESGRVSNETPAPLDSASETIPAPSDNSPDSSVAQPDTESKPDAPAAQATAILDAAAVTGKERIDVLKDVKAGDITPEELQAAYPAKDSALPAVKAGGERIEDSGQVLEGARKLYAKAYAAKLDEGMGMDTAAVPLSKSWPEPDYQRMLDDGADPWAVAMTRAMRDEVPNKPSQLAWKLKAWVTKVEALRAMAAKVVSGEITQEKFKTTAGQFALDGWLNKINLYEAVGHAESLKGVTFSKGEYGMYGGQTFSPPKTLWAITEPSKSASATWSHGNWGNELAVADTKEEAIAKFKEYKAKQVDKPAAAAKGTVFDIYSYRGKPGFIIGKRLSARKSIDLKTFDSAKEAREYKASHQAELEALLEAAKFEPSERRESNSPRVGADHRMGADVTTEQFRETFGFRGEQFGASMPQGERQSNLNQAYDALMDLAGVVGIPPKALSLNGELGLAFGARGTGGKGAFAAHYERDTTGAVTPNRVVINLTRKNGAGSLAHEWFHGVDNYFARMRGEKAGMLTESHANRGEGVRPEMIEAFKELMRTINLTGIKERSKQLDKKRIKDYWSTGLEMAARSFESYVIAKLQDQNASNDYLANIVPEEMYGQQAAYPYPKMGEIAPIRAAFDHFFDTIQTKETEQGVAMFSRATGFNDAVDAAIAAGIKGEKPGRGPVAIGSITPALKASGIPDGELRTSPVILAKAVFDHGVIKSLLKQVPDLLENPVMVLDSDTVAGSFVVVTSELVNGKPLLIIISPEKTRGGVVFNFVPSVYPKDDLSAIQRWLNIGKLRYIDQKQSPQWLGSTRLQLPGEYRSAKGLQAQNIATEADLVKPQDGIKESRTTVRNPSTVERVQAAITEFIGGKQLPNQLGRVVATTAAEIKSHWEPLINKSVNIDSEGDAGVAQAFFDPRTKTVFMIADHISQGNETAVLAHELMHKHGQAVLGKEGWARLHGVISSWEHAPADSEERAVYSYARNKVAAVGDHLSSQELFPYAVEAAIRMGIQPSMGAKKGTVSYWLESVRQNMRMVWGKITGKPESFRTQDLVDLAFGIAQRENPAHAGISLEAGGEPTAPDGGGAPMFSRASAIKAAANNVQEALKQTTVTDLIKQFGNRLSDFRGMGLQALGLAQLVDIYTKDLPSLKPYQIMVRQMDADKNESGAQADAMATGWGKLKDERQLAELMHDATLAQIDPDKPFVAGDDQSFYDALKHGFDALTPEAKQSYREARDMYSVHNDKVRQAIQERIMRSELSSAKKKALLERMDGEFFKKVKGVYFPLARFGQYVTIVKDSAGNVVSANRSETMNEAEATRKVLQSQFPAAGGYKVGKVLKDREFNAARDGVGRGFMADLFETLENTGADEALQDAISQLYLAALPDLSWAKHGIHRKGTPGFSQDARRAFAQNMFHGARYLAKLRYADQLQTGLDAMQEHIAMQSDNESYDSVKAQQVVDEMVKRHESMMNPQANPLSTALTSFGFVFHLGLSPASAIVNLSQTAMVALPVMSAKWGFGKSSAALLAASKQAASNKNDISAVLTGDERAAYDEAVRSGVIDVTMAHDLAGIAQGEDSKISAKIRPVMKAASFLFHHAEKFNRQVTFVAAYRLARAANASTTHAQAYEQAVKATYDGHFDYSASNRPRIMQGNVAKVVLLFKQYAQNMIYTLTRQAQQAIKAETPEGRKEARKALAGLLVSHAMAAGVFGLPLVGMLFSAASAIGGDDDEPWDAKVAFQNMLADAFGQKAAEVFAHGLSRLTPWDISGRVGLDKLLLPDIQEGLQGADAVTTWMAAALGPVAGIAVNAGKGMHDMAEGRYAKGLESMLPSALRAPLKAYRFETEGNIDKSGIAINDEVSLAGVAGQALGFSPSETRLAQEGKSAIYSADRAIQERRSSLVRQFAVAAMTGDEDGKSDARKDIARFNEKNPGARIKPMQLARSVMARRKRIAQAEQGVYLPKKRQGAMEAGRFAEVDD